MAIDFAPSVLTTKAETINYIKLKEMRFTSSLDFIDGWETIIDFEKDGLQKVGCVATYLSSSRSFGCTVGNNIKTADLKIQLNLRMDNRVSEIRYGDIDKDGDLDIAVKLTNGAIYVFHNLSK